MKSLVASTVARAFAATSIVLAFTSVAHADPVPFYWTDWSEPDLDSGAGFRSQGTITTPTSSVTATYTNPLGIGFYQTGAGTDFFANGSTASGTQSPYTSSLVANRPPAAEMIALQFAGSQTLTFSQEIANPVFAFVSLNRNGYAFDQDFEILSVGGEDGHACGYWGCGGVSKVIVDLGGGDFEYQLNANNVGGTEPHGTLRFTGTFDSVTWRSSNNENWNGFTVGVQGTAVEVCDIDPTLPGCDPGDPGSVPEPGTLALFGLGLAALVGRSRLRPSR